MNNLPVEPKTQDLKQALPPTPPPASQPPVPEAVVQTVQPTQPKGKKGVITKIFAALAIFLVLVLVSEVAYYFFTTRKQAQQASQERANTALEKIATEPSPATQTPTVPKEIDVIGGTINFERVGEIFSPYEEFKKEIFGQGEIKLVHGGKVTEITTDEEERTNIKMQTTTLPTKEYIMRFSKEEIESLVILGAEDSQAPTPIKFENIVVGDIIKVTQTFNILDKQGDNLTIIEVERGGE